MFSSGVEIESVSDESLLQAIKNSANRIEQIDLVMFLVFGLGFDQKYAKKFNLLTNLFLDLYRLY